MAGQSFTHMRSLGKYAVAGIAAAMLALGAAAMPAAAQTDGDGTAKKAWARSPPAPAG